MGKFAENEPACRRRRTRVRYSKTGSNQLQTPETIGTMVSPLGLEPRTFALKDRSKSHHLHRHRSLSCKASSSTASFFLIL
jgi:hypothetical protein